MPPSKEAALKLQRTPTPTETNQAAEAFIAGAGAKAENASTSKVPPEPEGRGLIKTRRGVQRRMTIYLPAQLAQRLKVYAATTDEGISDTVAMAVSRFLDAEAPAT